MKSFLRIVLSLTFILTFVTVTAAPVFNMPAVRLQPNGDTLHCFVSGDEFYHRLHDAQGYTIVQNPRNGYWVYADTVHSDADHWEVVATNYVAGTVQPSSVGLTPNLGIDRDEWMKRQHRFDIPGMNNSSPKTSGTNHGTLNNIVIFIRFSDENEISTSLTTINSMFNDSSSSSVSMYNYFKKVSYNKIFIPTYYFPTPNGNSVISYQDSLPRAYYMPYDASTNTSGYQNDTERRQREFGLLERAVNYVNNTSPIPSSLNLDVDNDGKVDNICFVVKGTYTGWSDLLWPHKWSLYDRQVYINNKRVYTFNLQLEGSGSHYFSSSTLCHEMFHTHGAPDLYRYDVGSNVSGVGSWDLMCSNTTPPQHMSAYMKWKYGNWLDSIPQITIPGTYTLHSLGDDSYDNCCYKIAAQEPHQWYVLEYRDNTEFFETGLPGKGLLIFRIDDRYEGNASYDGVNYFDEVWLFRPGSANDSTNGYLSQAYFSGNTSRTAFTPNTNPHPWLTGNVIDTTIAITDVTSPGVTISFTYQDLRGCTTPSNLSAQDITGHAATLRWHGNAPTYRLQWRAQNSPILHSQVVTGGSYHLQGLALNTQYLWRIKALCAANDSSDFSDWTQFRTTACVIPASDTVGTEEASYYYLPVNTYYNYTYSQMIYTPAEVGGAKEINRIAFNYASANPSTTKTDCVVYMGHTTQSTFTGTQMSNFVSFSQLQQVYHGSLNCDQGWNVFELEQPFTYNGTSNLVIAVLDTSGHYDGSSYQFYCTSTGNQYSSLTYYSDSYIPDPTASTYSGTKSRKQYRPDICFYGCPPVVSYTVSAVSANNEQGTVTGGGNYAEHDTAVLIAYPAQGWLFDHWQTPTGTVTANPYRFEVTANVSCTAYFVHPDVTVLLTTTSGGTVTGNGDYAYGSNVTITAEPANGYYFDFWLCETTGDTIRENPYTFTATSNYRFKAYFARVTHHVSVQSSDATLGRAWFNIDGDNEARNEATLASGTQLWLHIELNTPEPGLTYSFVGWSDGVPSASRLLTLVQDTALTAFFTSETVGINEAEAGLAVTTGNCTVVVVGAAQRMMELYDATGRRIYCSVGTERSVLPVPMPGVYLLRVEGFNARKVVVLR